MKIFSKDNYSDDELQFIESEHRKAYLKLFKSTLFVQFVFPFVLAYVFYELINETVLFAWLGALACVTIVRGLLSFAWYNEGSSEGKTKWFERLSLAMTFVAACFWGSTVLVMDFYQYPEASVFLNIIVFGLTAGSVGIGSYWLGYFLVYNITVFTIFIIGYLVALNETYYLLAVSLILFLVFMCQIALVFHRGNAQNIWLRKRTEKLAVNLSVKKQEAENAAASRTRFLSSASHDLRQPLQALSFLLSALAPELNSSKSQRLYEQLEKSADSMNDLLNSILDISRLDAEVVEIGEQDIELRKLLDDLCNQYQIQAENKGLALSVDIAIYEPNIYVSTDKVLLQRILSNLISNAISYTPKGSVTIRVVKQNNRLQIDIQDTGVGLSKTDQEQIFEEFFQLHNPERDRQKGLGLGLSIVQRLCNLLSLELTLKSEKGVGSCFSLIFPHFQTSFKREQAPTAIEPNTAIESVKLLLIDDELAVRESLKELVQTWGFSAYTADSASAACEQMKQTQDAPDIIISDYRLRDNKTGVDAINAVKAQLQSPDLPAIIITGDTDPERIKTALSSGYTLLHKPVKPAQLRVVIAKLLQ